MKLLQNIVCDCSQHQTDIFYYCCSFFVIHYHLIWTSLCSFLAIHYCLTRTIVYFTILSSEYLLLVHYSLDILLFSSTCSLLSHMNKFVFPCCVVVLLSDHPFVLSLLFIALSLTWTCFLNMFVLLFSCFLSFFNF